ncbi:F-box protein At4g22280 [Lolium perenne]|uniref:F-box protein At4g22280 n=1 Tax=Lolium perenne TaxID=4522 RepID=UPI0021F531A1|nr:F-box/FBD/LRR-repeat protein At1g16930-like isoform X2 [Lolium perenne]
MLFGLFPPNYNSTLIRSTGVPIMESRASRPSKVGQDRDRISALPDDLLLGILERLSLHEAVRAGAVSTRWRHLPHQLSRVDLDVDDFQGRSPDAFAGAVCRLLDCKCDCNSRRSVKTLGLRFHLSAPNLSSIGRAVEDTVTRGHTECLEFEVIPPTSDSDLTAVGRTELGQQFMSFSHACPIAFRWLTDLSLTSLDLGDADLPSLMGACDKLQHLSLTSCRFGWHSALQIDVPNSAIQSLDFVRCSCMRIELVSVPKLTHLMCESWNSENTPLRLGYVPQLRSVILCSHAGVWQAPFALSDCLTTDVTSLSQLHLNFSCQMIWIKPEHSKLLTPIFRNLKDLWLWHIFPECDLNWTLFILEAAPALQLLILRRARHSCVKTSEFSAEKANVVWEPSKDLKRT